MRDQYRASTRSIHEQKNRTRARSTCRILWSRWHYTARPSVELCAGANFALVSFISYSCLSHYSCFSPFPYTNPRYRILIMNTFEHVIYTSSESLFWPPALSLFPAIYRCEGIARHISVMTEKECEIEEYDSFFKVRQDGTVVYSTSGRRISKSRQQNF